MKSIIEFIESNPLSFMIAALVILVVILLIVKWNHALRKDYLNRDLDDRDDDDLDDRDDDDLEGRDDDDLDDRDDDDLEGRDDDDEEKPNGRFFVIESYYLPDEWEETFDVIVDRLTKVQYLNYGEYGITPLIDSNGKPILYKDDDEDQEEPE